MKRSILLIVAKPLWKKFRQECIESESTVPDLIVKFIQEGLQRRKMERDHKDRRLETDVFKRIAERLKKTGVSIPTTHDFDMLNKIGEIVEGWSFPGEETTKEVTQEKGENDDLKYLEKMFEN